ncbi:MAG: hypothetical protein IJY65_05790 [Clostridia bacterium]|nr:hypothetical protein [Clostridia bacterium]
MTEGFKKFSKRIRLEALIKCIVGALSAALFAVAVFIAAVKLARLDIGQLAVLWYLLVGVGACAATFGVLWLILYPSDKMVAKRIDESLGFSERAQSYVEFLGSDADVAVVQREDTNEKLLAAPLSLVKPKRVVVTAIALIMSLSLFVGSLVIPAVAEDEIGEGEVEEPVDEEQKLLWIEKIKALISRVKQDGLTPSLEESVVNDLEGLVSAIEATDKKSVIKAAAIAAVMSIDKALDEINTAAKLGAELQKAFDERVVDFGEALYSMVGSDSKKKLTAISRFLKSATQDDARILSNDFEAGIRNSGVGLEDTLCAALMMLAADMSKMTAADDYGELDGSISAASAVMSEVLLFQRVNRDTTNYVISELKKMFEITEEDLIDSDTDDSELGTGETDPVDPDDEEKDQGPQQGGAAGGELLYGSDEEIFDYKRGEYVKYGEVFNDYYKIIIEITQDEDMDPNLKAALLKYFSNLANGLQTENKEQN